jgi:hypothetical protein
MAKTVRLSAADIGRKLARKERWVEVPELGGSLRVVPPSLERLMALKDELGSDDQKRQHLCMLLAMCPDLGESVQALLDADGVLMSAVIQRVLVPVNDDAVGK